MYITIWVTSPILAYGTTYRVLALVTIIVWVILELSEKRNVFRKPTSYILLIYVFLIYTILVDYMTYGILGLTRNVQFYIMLFFLFVYASYQRKSLMILKPVVYLNLVLFTVWIITTYSGLLLDGHASRYMTQSNDIAVRYSALGIGGFAFIYSLLIYIILVMALLRKRIQEKKMLNIISIFLFSSMLLAMLVVLKAEFSTAVILMVLSVTFFIFYSKSLHRNIIMFLVFILFYLLVKEYILDFFQYLLQFAEGTNYSKKLQDMILSISSGDTSGSAHDRTERYLRSINAFLENPFLGTWNYNNIGKHSLVLDTFGRFGFFMGTILIYILLIIPYRILKNTKKNRTLALTVLFLIIALVSLNNIGMIYGFMFYVFYPYIVQRIENA